MSERTPGRIGLDEKVKAEDLLYASMFHTEDRGIMIWGFVAAFLIHVVLLVVPLPKFDKTVQAPDKNVVFVRKYVPPPPMIDRKQIVKK